MSRHCVGLAAWSNRRGAGFALSGAASAQFTFYENDGFQGRSFTTDRTTGNFERSGFNDRASSAVVSGARWEACADLRFGGRCAVTTSAPMPRP